MRIPLCLLLAFLLGGPGWAQTPLGEELLINQNSVLTQNSPHVAMTASGEFAIGWTDSREDTFPFTPFSVARFYDGNGRPYSDEKPLLGKEEGGPTWVLTSPRGGYRLYWGGVEGSAPVFFLQDYSPQGVSLSPLHVSPLLNPEGMLLTNVAISRSGKITLSFLANQFEMFAARLDPRGRPLGQRRIAATEGEVDPLYFGDIEVDSRGRAVATWIGNCGGFDSSALCDVLVQRLAPNGEKLGDPQIVNGDRRGSQGWSRVAVAPDGSFLVVWQRGEPGSSNPFALDVRGQRFSAAGEKLGREFTLGTTTRSTQFFPEASADPHGNYLTVWSSFRREDGRYGWDILGQLYRADGRKVGREFRINTRNTLNEFPAAQIAFGGNGTFVVVWNADDGDFDGIYAQRFAASPGDEPCRVQGEHLLCDTGRTGGEAELDLELPGGQIVLGDVDGDGRKDPCVFAAGRFECDTDHRGLPCEASLRFGREGDVPLFGDLDGDGREEPCVRRDRFFRCDTALDGGRAELAFPLGTAADQPLLGDVDGDGLVDACVYQAAGRFLCDLGKRGRADLVLRFGGEAGDVAALGDFDGDGRADPCIVRGGLWLCDTAHDGGSAEAQLRFGDSGGRPLLGNLDGL